MKSFWLPGGDTGIDVTISKMQSLVLGPQGVGSGLVRQAALEAVRGSIRNLTEIPALFAWVKNNIEFRGEREETLQSPEATLNLGAGDCDDHAMLLAAMGGSLGYEWDFKTVAVARDGGEHFSHVYAVLRNKHNGSWIPLDTTVTKSFPGWEPLDITREKMYRSRSTQRNRLLRGLGDDAT